MSWIFKVNSLDKEYNERFAYICHTLRVVSTS